MWQKSECRKFLMQQIKWVWLGLDWVKTVGKRVEEVIERLHSPDLCCTYIIGIVHNTLLVYNSLFIYFTIFKDERKKMHCLLQFLWLHKKKSKNHAKQTCQTRAVGFETDTQETTTHTSENKAKTSWMANEAPQSFHRIIQSAVCWLLHIELFRSQMSGQRPMMPYPTMRETKHKIYWEQLQLVKI